MGEMADAILEGEFCETCGDWLGHVVGYPRQCEACVEEDTPMPKWTPEREAAAEETVWRLRDEGKFRAARILEDAIDEIKRLRENMIGAWKHSDRECPCGVHRDSELNVLRPAPWQDCTCGLMEALWGQEGDANA